MTNDEKEVLARYEAKILELSKDMAKAYDDTVKAKMKYLLADEAYTKITRGIVRTFNDWELYKEQIRGSG